jgi:uncharacterized membrane protein
MGDNMAKKNKARNQVRIFELDFFRGIAVLLMVYFHIIFDLKEFYGLNINYQNGYIYYIGLISGATFIILAGVSSSLSKNNLKRGLKILVLGILLTVITSMIGKGTQIYFGILHLLGISMMLSHFIVKLSSKVWLFILLCLSSLVIFGNSYITQMKIDYNYLMIFGLKSSSFYSADYYPMIPWFGVFVIGILLGKILYGKKKSYLPFLSGFGNNPINFLGRYSLIIYLIHQPLVLLILEITKRLFHI